MPNNFFSLRPAVSPSIYAYEEPGNAELAGFHKIGFTTGDVKKQGLGKWVFCIILNRAEFLSSKSWIRMKICGGPKNACQMNAGASEPWTDEKLYAKYGLTAGRKSRYYVYN